MTVITYNEKQIDFGDLFDFFDNEFNWTYLGDTLAFCCDKLEPETITPLNPSDSNYLLFVKSLVFIHQHEYDLMWGFNLEFNSYGRPFQFMRKQMLTNDQKINFKKRLVHSNNNCTFVPLSDKSENNDMAKKKTETAIALIESTAATKLFESTSAKLSLVLAKCAEAAITSPEQAEAVTANAKELKAVIDDGDALRKEYKDPYYKAGVTIDAAFKAVIGDAPAVLDKQKQLLGAWNQVLAAEKAKRDAEANVLRQAEEAKKQLAQTEIGQIGVFLIELEKNSIEAITAITDRKQLRGIWDSNIAPYLDKYEQFKALAEHAKGVITRIAAFGHAKDAVLSAPNPVKDQTFTIEKSKAIVAAKNAEAEIVTAITQAQHQVAVVAEVAKSDITQAQIADKVETVVETRRSPIKYEVIDITLCPADFTMTVINEDYMKKVISEHAAAIDANPLIVPGIRFYRDAIVKL